MPTNFDNTFLPVGRMRQISRIRGRKGSQISAELDLGPDHWVYPDHFPGDPIFPGCLMIEAAGQLVALWAWGDGARGNPRLVKCESRFHHPVRPEHPVLRLSADVRQRRNLYLSEVTLRANGEAPVATVSIVLSIQPAD